MTCLLWIIEFSLMVYSLTIIPSSSKQLHILLVNASSRPVRTSQIKDKKKNSPLLLHTSFHQKAYSVRLNDHTRACMYAHVHTRARMDMQLKEV